MRWLYYSLYPSRLTSHLSSRKAAASKILMIKFFMLIPFLKHLNSSLFTLNFELGTLNFMISISN